MTMWMGNRKTQIDFRGHYFRRKKHNTVQGSHGWHKVHRSQTLMPEVCATMGRYIWVSYNISLTWNRVIWVWSSESSSHDSRARSQWGHYNLRPGAPTFGNIMPLAAHQQRRKRRSSAHFTSIAPASLGDHLSKMCFCLPLDEKLWIHLHSGNLT